MPVECPDGSPVIINGQTVICKDAGGGTDPNGTSRFPPLVKFLKQVNDNENTFYSSINFSDTASAYFEWKDPKGARTSATDAIKRTESNESVE